MNIPRATYRLQFCPGFGFRDAGRIVPYLAGLGISHIYASPVFKARSGSEHGYDIVDPNRLNPELGGPEEFKALTALVRDSAMFWLQDIVPNHMAFSSENLRLMDVLESGPRSRWYDLFDIDWQHPDENLRGRLLMPVLGKLYAEALEGGDIRLAFDECGFRITYVQMSFPLRAQSYASVLEKLPPGPECDCARLAKITASFSALAAIEENEPYREALRRAKDDLLRLYAESAGMQKHIDDTIDVYNGRKGVSETWDALDELLSGQLFRLAYWKVATEEINYRRFFTINDLISVNVENEAVFSELHTTVLHCLDDGTFDGVRVDHIDGLYDPEVYLRRLRAAAPDAYIVVEKILDQDERLPPSWPVQGTTGYDMLNILNGLFCRSDQRRTTETTYNRFIGHKRYYAPLALQTRQLIIGRHLAGSVDNLARFLKNLSARDRRGRDITMYGLKRALVEIMSHLQVYRTYVRGLPVDTADRLRINRAVDSARTTLPGQRYELDFIRTFLLLAWGDIPDAEKNRWVDFVMTFQQHTGPVTAKAVEDTLFYRYNRLISLNEVGGNPSRFGIARGEFHAFNASRAAAVPYSLSATATHDTKRGEDVRARIHVLSELADEWRTCVRQWKKANRRRKTGDAPDANDEYFIYQTLIGAWPLKDEGKMFLSRMQEYIVKAVREAKVHTAWIEPDSAYEDACLDFIEKILTPADHNAFLPSFLPFQNKTAFYGMLNGLSQTALKCTVPGVPDFFQGTELWDLSLVDPDNRRPVDYDRRIAMLSEIRERDAADTPGLIEELLNGWRDGRVKLFLTYRLLQARARCPELFRDGGYRALTAAGRCAESLVAFERTWKNTRLVTIAPRFLTRVVPEGVLPLGGEVWKDTEIAFPGHAPRTWTDAVTGESLQAAGPVDAGAVLNRFPTAVLISEEEST